MHVFRRLKRCYFQCWISKWENKQNSSKNQKLEDKTDVSCFTMGQYNVSKNHQKLKFDSQKLFIYQQCALWHAVIL